MQCGGEVTEDTSPSSPTNITFWVTRWSAADPCKPGLCPPRRQTLLMNSLSCVRTDDEGRWQCVRRRRSPNLPRLHQERAWRGKRACEGMIMCSIHLVHYNIWETSLKTMTRIEGCHSAFTFRNLPKAFVPLEWIMDRPQIIQDNRTEGCVCLWENVNVCFVLVCVLPLIFNSSAGPFCKALQDKLPRMVVFERQCSAQRKGQGWNTENRPIKIHHFDPRDLLLLGGRGGGIPTHTDTQTSERAPPTRVVRVYLEAISSAKVKLLTLRLSTKTRKLESMESYKSPDLSASFFPTHTSSRHNSHAKAFHTGKSHQMLHCDGVSM